jgi:hypothetical protein
MDKAINNEGLNKVDDMITAFFETFGEELKAEVEKNKKFQDLAKNKEKESENGDKEKSVEHSMVVDDEEAEKPTIYREETAYIFDSPPEELPNYTAPQKEAVDQKHKLVVRLGSRSPERSRTGSTTRRKSTPTTSANR